MDTRKRQIMGKTLVLGLGNPLVTDDRIGLCVAAELKHRLAGRPDVDVDEDYWGGLRLMERMVGYDRVVVIDAIQTGAAPGTVHRLGVDSIPTQRSASSHDVNLPTALALGRLAGYPLPANDAILLVAIEAEDILTFGDRCTPAVEAAIGPAVQCVLEAIDATPPIGHLRPEGCFSAPLLDRRTAMISPELLRRYPYFAGIDDDCLKAVAMIAEEKTVPAGTHLFSEGDPADWLNIIVKGEVNIQYVLGSGEKRTVDTLVDGDILGFSAIVEPYKYTALGTASKDTHLIAIQGKKLRELCDKEPLLGYLLMSQVARLLAHRLEGARVQLAASD